MAEIENSDTQSCVSADQEIKPTHSEDGVDLTLIRWFLSLTPAERLEALQQTVRSIMKVRDRNLD